MDHGAPEDARWLAAAVPILLPGTRLLDVGCGVGTLALAVQRRMPGVEVQGVEIQPEAAAVAQAAGLSVWVGDVLDFEPAQPVQAVVCNPPFHAVHRGFTAGTLTRRLAHGLQPGQLTAWFNKLAKISIPQAYWWLVLHSACQAEVAAYVQAQDWAVSWVPLATHPTRPPKRALLQISLAGPKAWVQLPAVPGFDPVLRDQVLRQGAGLMVFGASRCA